MVCSTFFNFSSLTLRNYIFESAKKCEMTPFYMTSLHVDLNEAAKCVDIIPLITSLLIAHSYKIQSGDDIWPNLRRFIKQFMKVGGIKTWKELTIGVQELAKLLFNNNFINPGPKCCGTDECAKDGGKEFFIRVHWIQRDLGLDSLIKIQENR